MLVETLPKVYPQYKKLPKRLVYITGMLLDLRTCRKRLRTFN